jgi:hypothetical protein
LPEEILIHESLLVAVQLQPLVAVTLTVAVPPLLEKDLLVGEIK